MTTRETLRILFDNLAATTLAAIVADLDDVPNISSGELETDWLVCQHIILLATIQSAALVGEDETRRLVAAEQINR